MHSIAKLKRLLTEAGKLGEIWNYFFDLMDEGILLKDSHPISDPTKDDTLIAVLAAVQKSTGWQLGQEIPLAGLTFSKTPSEHFYQGACAIQNMLLPAVVFYFSDIEMGALTYSKNGRSEMYRFSLTNVTNLKTQTKH